jgi:hypothetical protein
MRYALLTAVECVLIQERYHLSEHFLLDGLPLGIVDRVKQIAELVSGPATVFLCDRGLKMRNVLVNQLAEVPLGSQRFSRADRRLQRLALTLLGLDLCLLRRGGVLRRRLQQIGNLQAREKYEHAGNHSGFAIHCPSSLARHPINDLPQGYGRRIVLG